MKKKRFFVLFIVTLLMVSAFMTVTSYACQPIYEPLSGCEGEGYLAFELMWDDNTKNNMRPTYITNVAYTDSNETSIVSKNNTGYLSASGSSRNMESLQVARGALPNAVQQECGVVETSVSGKEMFTEDSTVKDPNESFISERLGKKNKVHLTIGEDEFELNITPSGPSEETREKAPKDKFISEIVVWK